MLGQAMEITYLWSLSFLMGKMGKRIVYTSFLYALTELILNDIIPIRNKSYQKKKKKRNKSYLLYNFSIKISCENLIFFIYFIFFSCENFRMEMLCSIFQYELVCMYVCIYETERLRQKHRQRRTRQKEKAGSMQGS